MQTLFGASEVFESDIYLADYTNKQGDNRGVVITAMPPADIKHFTLLNPLGIPCLGVNIEEYPAFKKGIQNCEAMFCPWPAAEDRRSWVLMAELKYCSETKIEDYGPKAVNQMDGVRLKLMEMNKISREKHTVHFNYCSPGNAAAEPFDGFRDTQSGALTRVETDGVIFHARMALIAVDEELLLEPPVEI